MLNRSMHSIISVFKWLLPMLLLFFIVPQLVQLTSSLNHLQQFLHTYQWLFFISHLLFYLLLYCLWPKLIQLLLLRHKEALTPAQLKSALQAREYLLMTLLFIECLMRWK